jgi:hypothetical protein
MAGKQAEVQHKKYYIKRSSCGKGSKEKTRAAGVHYEAAGC